MDVIAHPAGRMIGTRDDLDLDWDAIYAEAARIVVGDAPDIWVYNTVEVRGLRARVKGFKFSPVGSGAELRFMSLQGN